MNGRVYKKFLEFFLTFSFLFGLTSTFLLARGHLGGLINLYIQYKNACII